jgi:hypothetical protein
MEKVGIYQILNISNGKCYIGKSKDILSRENSHFSHLKKGKHSNKKLINIPIDNLKFNILIECDFKDLDYYEWFYIKQYNSIKNGYNIANAIDFKNVNLSEYRKVIEDFKILLHTKYEFENIIINKYYCKKIYDIYNFNAFCNLLSKEEFTFHNMIQYYTSEIQFELKNERDKIFNSLNY